MRKYIEFAESLTPGEYVVHVDQGVARFVGLTRTETSGVEREYLLLEYARGDKLYVPIDQSDRVTRYSSGGSNHGYATGHGRVAAGQESRPPCRAGDGV